MPTFIIIIGAILAVILIARAAQNRSDKALEAARSAAIEEGGLAAKSGLRESQCPYNDDSSDPGSTPMGVLMITATNGGTKGQRFWWLAGYRSEKRVMENLARLSVYEPKLPGEDEVLAGKIRDLLFSASFQESKSPEAYRTVSGQLAEIGDSIRSIGRERWLRIKDRARVLCGKHFLGFSSYYDHLGPPPNESPSIQPPAESDPQTISTSGSSSHTAPQAPHPDGNADSARFLSQLSGPERIAVIGLSSGIYESVITARKRGYTNLASVDLRVPGSTTTADPAPLLWKLPIPDLECLAKSSRLGQEADSAADEDLERAGRLYREALDLNPFDAIAVMSCGVVLAKQGDLLEGKKWMERALALDPANQRIKRNLEAIQSYL